MKKKNFDTASGSVEFSFSKNGIDLGTAFVVPKKDLDDFLEKLNSEAANSEDKQDNLIFFPHVLTKNVVFEMNFGQRVSLIGDEPFAPIKSDFRLIQKLPIENRFFNEIPKDKKDNEVRKIFFNHGFVLKKKNLDTSVESNHLFPFIGFKHIFFRKFCASISI